MNNNNTDPTPGPSPTREGRTAEEAAALRVRQFSPLEWRGVSRQFSPLPSRGGVGGGVCNFSYIEVT